MKIVLTEVVPRGFLSNYITILTSFRGLINNEGINPDDILISNEMFSHYGNPKNWFDEKKVTEIVEGNIYRSSIEYLSLDPWPTSDQLNLLQYAKYFSYNERIVKYLNQNTREIKNGFGIHYRGTDHHEHVNRISLSNYFETILNSFSPDEYDSVFICSDEDDIVLEFESFFKKQFNFKNIVINEVIRSKTNLPSFLTEQDYNVKVKLGDEILLDSHCLSSCNCIIGKTSNVINYARILNPNTNVLYLDKGYSFR